MNNIIDQQLGNENTHNVQNDEEEEGEGENNIDGNEVKFEAIEMFNLKSKKFE